jgi:hypothetical protein
MVDAALVEEEHIHARGDEPAQLPDEKPPLIVVPFAIPQEFFFRVIVSWRNLLQTATWLTPSAFA